MKGAEWHRASLLVINGKLRIFMVSPAAKTLRIVPWSLCRHGSASHTSAFEILMINEWLLPEVPYVLFCLQVHCIFCYKDFTAVLYQFILLYSSAINCFISKRAGLKMIMTISMIAL